MEPKPSTVNQAWKIGTIWSLIGCLTLLFFLNQKSNFQAPLCQFHPTKGNVQTPISQPKAKPPNNLTTQLPDNDPTKSDKIDEAKLTAPLPDNVPLKSDNIDEAKLTTPLPADNDPIKSDKIDKLVGETKKMCNIFEGRWVYDPKAEPMYDGTQCPFMDEAVSCRSNGREDFEYEKWRWEARDCDLPLFNGTDMLERLRNKRFIIVGDSLNRNQWQSLACLLYSSISPSRVEVHAGGSPYKFLKAKDYNCSVEFYWSPFLTELNQAHESGQKVLVLDKISPISKHWRGADVMVFNSVFWWNHPDKIKAWKMYQYKGQLIEELPREVAYEMGMKTWTNWLEQNVDPQKTKVFFRSVSAEHNGNFWCYNSTQPIMDESYKSKFPKAMVEVIERTIKGMNPKLQVHYLNITKLSQYRRDAHPSIYYKSLNSRVETTSSSTSRPHTDCSHWCLPGLPDTWNRLLYASLFFDVLQDMSSS